MTDSATRPGLAILANVLTPYRVHLHARVAKEVPELQLHSILTHSFTEFRWQIDLPEGINLVRFTERNQPAKSSALWYALTDFRKAGRILKYFEQHNIRAVVVPGYNDLTRLLLLRACRKRGIAVFLRGDSNIKGDLPAGSLKARVKNALVRWAIRQAHAVMPMGELGRQYFAKYGATKFFDVPYEPDYALFQSVDNRALQAFCDEKGLQPGRKRLLYSGRLAPVKRVDLLIDAFARIADDRPDWDPVIAGDGILRAELEARVPVTGADRVTWLGFCEMDQLRLVYHACAVLVHPSAYEPWALVINEALAAGLVVVSSDVVGAAYEMVESGVNGELFASGDVDDLERQLLAVTDPAQLPDYQQNVPAAFERYRRRCDPVQGIRAALHSVGLLASVEPVMTESQPS